MRFVTLLGGLATLCLLIAAPAQATHPRPSGASPFRASLVPAYEPCVAPDRTHGPPLAFPSCSSPRQASRYATLGTPDANGAPAKSVSFFKLRISVGLPNPPHDTRALLTTEITDVRCTPAATTCGSGNTVGGADYVGELDVVHAMRITDHASAVPPATFGSDPATMEYTVHFAAVCAETLDDTIGSRCRTSNDASGYIPGFTPEGQRTIWELGQTQVFAGGADGSASSRDDNTVFLRQGLFVP